MKYIKTILWTTVSVFLLGINSTYSSENVKLTKSEVAKLKDYLTSTRDDAVTKVAETEARLAEMREQGLDLQSDAVKVVKNELYKWQDIVDGNNKLLEQLRTGKYSYSLVMAQLKSLGTNPQETLQITGVRARLLAGEKVHPLIVEIDAINPSRSKQEIEQAFKDNKVGNKTDMRMNYILVDLLYRLFNKLEQITNNDDLTNALSTIMAWITQFQNDASVKQVLKTRVIGDPLRRTGSYSIIDQIMKKRNLQIDFSTVVSK